MKYTLTHSVAIAIIIYEFNFILFLFEIFQKNFSFFSPLIHSETAIINFFSSEMLKLERRKKL